MLKKLSAGIVLVLSFSWAAWSGDAKKGLDGTWVPSEAELAGKNFPDIKDIKLVIKGDKYTVTVGKATDAGTLKHDAKAKPKTLDITGTEGPNNGKTILAIYEHNGDTL